MRTEFSTWLRQKQHQRMRNATTIQMYEQQIMNFENWLRDALGLPLAPDTISHYRMHAYLGYLQTTLKRAPATQQKTIAALRLFGSWLVAMQYLPSNPAQQLRAQAEQPSPPRALDQRVISRMRDAAYHTTDLRDAVVIELLATSGMRSSEIAHIQLADLERGARTMWIRLIGKGAKQRRIPLPKRVGLLIERYLAERRTVSGIPVTTGPLLIGQRGGITRTTINTIVENVAQQARLTPAQRATVTPHAFRHTVATTLVRSHDIVIAADILGHSSLNTTRRYTKASAGELEAIMETLAESTA